MIIPAREARESKISVLRRNAARSIEARRVHTNLAPTCLPFTHASSQRRYARPTDERSKKNSLKLSPSMLLSMTSPMPVSDASFMTHGRLHVPSMATIRTWIFCEKITRAALRFFTSAFMCGHCWLKPTKTKTFGKTIEEQERVIGEIAVASELMNRNAFRLAPIPVLPAEH